MPEIKTILQSRAVEGGHAIEIDVEYSDGSKVTMKCPMELAGRLSDAIHAAAVAAERLKNTQPKQEVSLDVPYQATQMRAGLSVDGKHVAARFLTTIGTPFVIAMPPDLTRETIQRLQAELDKIGKLQPFRPS